MSVDISGRAWSTRTERTDLAVQANHVQRRVSTLVRFCWSGPACPLYAGRMNWATLCILLTSVLAPHAATPATGAGVGSNEIESAREAWHQAAEVLGEDHPVTALMLRNLALAMQQGGYSNYAEHYALQSLSMLERRFGATDVTLVPVLNVLAEAAVSQGRYSLAREYATRGVAIGPDAGVHFATALHNLAAAFRAEGKLTEAVQYYRDALAARERFLPAGHPYIQLTRAALEHVQRSVKLMAVTGKKAGVDKPGLSSGRR